MAHRPPSEANTGDETATRPGRVARLTRSAVVWSWLFNGLRLASGLLVLPLLIRALSATDLGMYYVFLDLAMIVPMVDFGFALSIERSLAYALGGATSLAAMGLGAEPADGRANHALVSEIIVAARRLYRGLALGAFALLTLAGAVMVNLRVGETTLPAWTWMAFGLHVASSTLEIYTGYWVAVLRGLNRVTDAARWLSLAYGLKLGLSVAFLLFGAGLAAVPVAGLIAGFVLRAGARREVRRLTRDAGAIGPGALRRVVSALWPNSWRLGIQLVALFLGTYIFSFICQRELGLAAKAEYGLSLQVINIALGIAAVWTSVKWPVVAQLRIRGEREAMQVLLRPRFWLQVATFIVLASVAIAFGPPLLAWMDPAKRMLPRLLLGLMALNALGELHFTFWTTLISTENRIPALWALVATQAASVIGVVILVFGFHRGLDAFVVAPLVVGSLWNYWWWAREGARMLGTTLPRFLLRPFFSPHARRSPSLNL